MGMEPVKVQYKHQTAAGKLLVVYIEHYTELVRPESAWIAMRKKREADDDEKK